MKSQDKKMIARKQDEMITNRILTVFSFSLLMLLAVMFIGQYMNSYAHYPKTLTFCIAASVAFGVIGAGLIVFVFVKYKKDTANVWFGRLMTIGGMALLAAAVLLFIRVYTFRAFGVLYAVLPIAAFLYMIFNIYQRDFFYQSIVAGCTAVTLYAFSRWLHYKPWKLIVHMTYITAITLLIAAAILLLILRMNKGKFLNITLLPYNVNYNIMLSTSGIMLLAIIAVLILGSIYALWAMAGVLGYLFVLAVYYTIKLM